MLKRTFSGISRFFVLVAIGLLLSQFFARAADGDTIRVKTVKFGDVGQKQQGTFLFPPKSVNYQKVLLNYTLKCPTGKPCGEWDYLMYVYLDHKTGRMDSTYGMTPNFRVNGSTRATFSYMASPAWTYSAPAERATNRTATTREGTKNANNQTISMIGSGSLSSALPFNTKNAGGRSVFLWKASELTAAGLLPGAITGLQFDVLQSSVGVNKLRIGLKHTSLSAMDATQDYSGFTTVYERSTILGTGLTGRNILAFTDNFVWDGTSNVLVEFVQSNRTDGDDSKVAATDAGFSAGLSQSAKDAFTKFDGNDYIICKQPAKIDVGTVEARFMISDISGQKYIVSNDRDAGAEFPGYHLFVNGNRLYAAIWKKSDNTIVTISGGTLAAGRWYHAAMTFTGTALVLYLDGSEVARVGVSATTIADPAYPLMIGVLAYSAPTYYRMKGAIDEVRIWKQPLSEAEIQAWKHRAVNPTHPSYQNLLAYFPMDEGVGYIARDVKGGNDGIFQAGKGNWGMFDGASLNLSSTTTSIRPNILFEQGVYTANVKNVFAPDSVKKEPLTLVLYNDVNRPRKGTDTIAAYQEYYRYRFLPDGSVLDSTLVPNQTTLTLSYKASYSDPFEVVNRYELMRYITPYGNGLSLGNGFRWTMDITDYAPILHDSVRISAFNQQEDLELTFDLITGTPPRNVIQIDPLWFGNPQYGQTPSIEEFLNARRMSIPAESKGTKLRVIQSGHGFAGDAENCAEFCDKIQYVKVDGVQRYNRHVWRDNCGLTPVYPQGGTWVYNRTNWCPGAEVQPFDYELTPFVKAGDSALIDVDMENYTFVRIGTGTAPNYVISSVLFNYGAPNFSRNASLERILAPTTHEFFKRRNPICLTPVILVKNNGSTAMTSLDIEYGVKGGIRGTYKWTGNLKFDEQAEIALPALNWGNWAGEKTFEVRLTGVNGAADEYSADNFGTSQFILPPLYFNEFEVRLKTNKFAADQYEWTLKNSSGAVVAGRKNMTDYTQYVDSLFLPEGCYEFRLINKEGIGLDWWATRDQVGSGSLSFTSLGKQIALINPDFGSEVYQQFRVGVKPAGILSTELLEFGTLKTTEKKQLTVDITPKNSAGLEVSASSVVLASKGFKVVSTSPDLSAGTVKLAYGEKLTFTVEFAPSSGGAKTARLVISTNDERNPQYNVQLSGNAEATSVEENAENPTKLWLSVSPSIVSQESQISFTSGENIPVTLKIVDALGRNVATLFEGMAYDEEKTVVISAQGYSSGMYFAVLSSALGTKVLPIHIVR